MLAEKLTEVVGLYAEPPAHAAVLSFDAKGRIQALVAFSEKSQAVSMR
ncbi:hypothetical protein [Novosphingobium sp. CF614]|nr:hypothetical protein [Novosphingobium sp. CF614]